MLLAFEASAPSCLCAAPQLCSSVPATHVLRTWQNEIWVYLNGMLAFLFIFW